MLVAGLRNLQHADGFADVFQEICIEKSEAYPRRSDKPADVDCRSSLPNRLRHEYQATSASYSQVCGELHRSHPPGHGIAGGVIGRPPPYDISIDFIWPNLTRDRYFRMCSKEEGHEGRTFAARSLSSMMTQACGAASGGCSTPTVSRSRNMHPPRPFSLAIGQRR
jgi:hypothetical protein